MTPTHAAHAPGRPTAAMNPAPADPADSRSPLSLWGSFRPAWAKVAWIALIAHVMAMAFALGGILYVIPNLAKFATNPDALRVYNWGMSYGGATHMILGAIAVFAMGLLILGLRRAASFFVIAYVLSASSELIGTGTGFPFGNYSYTDFLGFKLLGRVPFTIPMSWFYMGLTSYVLARLIVWLVGNRLSTRAREIASGVLGMYLVVVWDLVLDPAMAHRTLAVRFWEWHVDGLYFGMPIRNYVGWAFTALLFITLSRLSWGRTGIEPRRVPVMLPVLVYGFNIAFASILSLSVSLWLPIVLCVGLILLPVAVALILRRAEPPVGGRERAAGRTIRDGAAPASLRG